MKRRQKVEEVVEKKQYQVSTNIFKLARRRSRGWQNHSLGI
jgi:hypothetical protein